MSLEYLHFNIFGLALSDMATSSGSLSERLSTAYMNHLHKIRWDKDLQLIPSAFKKDFLYLKKILSEEVSETIQKQREDFQQSFQSHTYSQEELGYMSNTKIVIKGLHWTKAKRAAEIISSLYFGLGYSVKDQD